MKKEYLAPDFELLQAQAEEYCSGLADLSSIVDVPSSEDDGGRGNSFVNDDL